MWPGDRALANESKLSFYKALIDIPEERIMTLQNICSVFPVPATALLANSVDLSHLHWVHHGAPGTKRSNVEKGQIWFIAEQDDK